MREPEFSMIYVSACWSSSARGVRYCRSLTRTPSSCSCWETFCVCDNLYVVAWGTRTRWLPPQSGSLSTRTTTHNYAKLAWPRVFPNSISCFRPFSVSGNLDDANICFICDILSAPTVLFVSNDDRFQQFPVLWNNNFHRFPITCFPVYSFVLSARVCFAIFALLFLFFIASYIFVADNAKDVINKCFCLHYIFRFLEIYYLSVSQRDI